MTPIESMSIREAARLAGCGEKLVRRAVRAGRLAALRLGERRLRITPGDLARWIESRRLPRAGAVAVEEETR
jgi:excisionase family DNA binding protein